MPCESIRFDELTSLLKLRIVFSSKDSLCPDHTSRYRRQTNIFKKRFVLHGHHQTNAYDAILKGYAVKPPNRNAIRFISLQRMKQTNNAIKFLMAQYRAIFKNANIAMVAAMAAAALAAGQANAAVGNWDALKNTVNVTTAETITGQAVTDTNANGFTINVNTGGTLNFVGATGNATSFEMGGDKEGKIFLEGGKLVVGTADASGASVKVNSVTATAGTIVIGGHASDSSTLEAGQINLGGAENVTVTIKKGGVLGGATSEITVGTGTAVGVGDDTTNSAIAGTKLTVNGGSVTVKENKDFKISSKEVEVKDGSISNGTGTLTFEQATEITFASGTITNTGTIALNTNGATLTVDASDFKDDAGLFKGAGKVTAAGADAQKVYTIKVNGNDAVDLGLLIDNTGAKKAANVDVTTGKLNLEANAVSFSGGTIGTLNNVKVNTLEAGANKALNISGSQVDVSKTLTVHGQAEGVVTVDNAGTLSLDGANGTVTAKSIVVGGTTKGNLNVKNGKWSLPSVDIKSGSVSFDKAEITLQSGATLTTKGKDDKLTLTNTNLDVTAGKVQLAESGAAINTGSKLVIGKDQLYTVNTDGKTVALTNKADANKVVKNSLSTDGSGVLQIVNAGEVGSEITASLKTELNYDGFIQFAGESTIKPSSEKEVNFSSSVDMSTVGVYDKTRVVMDGQDNAINKNVAAGSIKLNAKDNIGVVSKGLILSNASETGNNMFVQSSDGKKVGDLQLSGTGATATLNGSGKIGNINGDKAGSGSLLIGSEAYGKSSNVTVEGSIGGTAAVGKITVAKDSTLTIKPAEGTAKLVAHNLTLSESSTLDAAGQDVTIGEGTVNVATINGSVKAKNLTLAGTGKHNLAGGANVIVDQLIGNQSGTINVGADGVPNGSASVMAGQLVLNQATLNIDPDYQQPYASVIVNNLSTDLGDTLDGHVNVGHNALFAVGFDNKAKVDAVLGSLVKNGSFTDPNPSNSADSSAEGAEVLAKNAVVLNKRVKFTASSGIYVGTVDGKKAANNTLEVDSGSALVITDKALGIDPTTGKKTSPAITAHNGTGGTAAIAKGANLVLVGAFNGADNDLEILKGFNDTANQMKNFKVSIGGSELLVADWTADGKLDISLTENKAKLAAAFAGASTPVKQFMLDMLDGTKFAFSTEAGYQLIDSLAKAENGVVADAAAHAATYAGAQQAAVASVTTMADAMFGRVGAVGVEAASISATGSQANGGVWLTPMYKSVDSDGFNAQGASYGSDVDLSGVAFGADTVNGNMRFGAVFNIGSGDAEGKGNGNGLKDEFNYYGFGVYSAMGVGSFALVGDASVTVVSHDVTGLDLKGEADTTALTMGVTGQYTISTPSIDVTPHLGARLTRLDTDSYDLISDDGVVANTDFDVQNVFSIPLGVTLSKAFVAGGWSLAPSADLTIAFNTGDTDAKSTTRFTGINKNLDLTAEVLDEVQYGLTVGLGAQYGAFGTSFGINYTGSENTDAFGVNAQARYMF